MNPRKLAAVAGPALYAILALAAHGRLPALEGAQGLLLACALFTVAAIAALAIGASAPLTRDEAALGGLGALAIAMLLPDAPALHAAMILLAAIGLGAAFAEWVAPRIRDFSVVLTAAACLALFDFWSVRFGPARKATEGGLLKRLLLDVPAPAGWIRFLGISDLVVVALLAGLCALRGVSRGRAFGAGALGVLASLGQAYLTRGPAPALPWIGGFFALAAWPQVRPGREGWLRTARWAGGTALLLGALTAVKLATA